MRFSLWTQYGALNSKPVFDAFRCGAKLLGYDCVDNDPSADVDVIWSVLFSGRMAGNRAIWDRAAAQSKPVVVLEVGGIRRGTTWKVGVNGINRDGYLGPVGCGNSRADVLGLRLRPWRTEGEHILICTQHPQSLQWQNMPPLRDWVTITIETIREHSDRPILVRPHPRARLEPLEHRYKDVRRQEPHRVPGTYDDFDMKFKNIWATVSWSSNPGIHSILNGVPAIVGPSSLAYAVAEHDLANIENPCMPDRTQWLNDLAHTEWTVQEIAQGIPLKQLTSKLF